MKKISKTPELLPCRLSDAEKCWNELNISDQPTSYYTNKSCEGYIMIVKQQKNSNDFYVYLSNNKIPLSEKILVSEKQYKELSMLYKKGRKIRAKLRLEKSLFSQRILSAKLIKYRVKSVLSFPYNLHKVNLSILKEI